MTEPGVVWEGSRGLGLIGVRASGLIWVEANRHRTVESRYIP